MIRAAQARLLVRPLWRTGTWWLIPAATAAVVIVTGVLELAGVDVEPVLAAGAGALLLAAVAGFALDDAAAVTVASSPSPPAFRHGVRLTGTYVAVAACWATLLVVYAPGEVARPTLLLATLVTVGLLAASFWGGVASAPVVLAALVSAMRIPTRWSVLEDVPGATARLGALLAVAAVALLARCARDRTGY